MHDEQPPIPTPVMSLQEFAARLEESAQMVRKFANDLAAALDALSRRCRG